jgi:hypothetical protein
MKGYSAYFIAVSIFSDSVEAEEGCLDGREV